MLRTLPIRSYLPFVLGVSSTSILDIKCISATMPSIDVLRSSFVSSRDNLINFLFKRILLSVASGGSGMLSAEPTKLAYEKSVSPCHYRMLTFYKTAVMF